MLRIELLAWDAARAFAAPIRFAVFVDEQRVPAEIELDDQDAASLHAIARDAQSVALGTGRLLPTAKEAGRKVSHIGRMAVLRDARGRGVGAALLNALVEAARARGDEEIVLSAQVSAEGFYRGRGFIAEGAVYAEAGIAHRDMRLRLRD
ncbi:MAG TPA: GNAT family N-acetyltransferase [Burkholderiales bacterium]